MIQKIQNGADFLQYKDLDIPHGYMIFFYMYMEDLKLIK